MLENTKWFKYPPHYYNYQLICKLMYNLENYLEEYNKSVNPFLIEK